MDHLLKSLLNLLQYCLCLMFWVFGPKACEILLPQSGIKPAPHALEGEVLTSGPPGKSLSYLSSLFIICFFCVTSITRMQAL